MSEKSNKKGGGGGINNINMQRNLIQICYKHTEDVEVRQFIDKFLAIQGIYSTTISSI